jgi:hypothetical protein
MKNRNYILAIFITVISIIAIQIAIGITVYKFLPDWPTRGQFGDVFGAANALFSGLAFAGLIYAILLQREDLALQRKELELTRQELQRSAAAQEKSESALSAQAASVAQSTKLNTINFLLEHYKSKLSEMRNQAYISTDPRLTIMNELMARETKLTKMLDSLFTEISQAEENKNEV